MPDMAIDRAIGRYLRQRGMRKRQQQIKQTLSDQGIDGPDRAKLQGYINYYTKYGGGVLKLAGFALFAILGLVAMYFGYFVATDVPVWFTGFFVLIGAFFLGMVLINVQRYRRARELKQILSTNPHILLEAERSNNRRNDEPQNYRR